MLLLNYKFKHQTYIKTFEIAPGEIALLEADGIQSLVMIVFANYIFSNQLLP